MAIKMTLHAGVGTRDVLTGQNGEAVSVADGGETAALPAGFYRICATSDCTLRIGVNLNSATGGEAWPKGSIEVRQVRTGENIAVDAGV